MHPRFQNPRTRRLPAAALAVTLGLVPLAVAGSPAAAAPQAAGRSAVAAKAGGVLAAGRIPAAGQVGFRGDARKLRVINSARTAPRGTRWAAPGYLEVTGGNVVLDRVRVKGGIRYAGSGTLKIRNSIVEGRNLWSVIQGDNSAGRLDVRDSTIRWTPGAPPPGEGWGNGAISGDSKMTILRCDISGTPDGIQQGSGHSLFQQNYIHHPAIRGKYPNNTHNDGIQLYGGSGIVIKNNRIDLGAFDGEHQNGALFFQGTFSSPQIIGNYLRGGGFMLRLEQGTSRARVSGNRFGPLGKAWGYVLVGPGAVGKWSGNTTSAGKTVARP